MPQFAHPWCLLLVLVLPVVGWVWIRRDRPALLFSDTRLLAGSPPGRARWVPWCGLGLRLLTLGLLVIALAGPRWPDLRTRVRTEGIAIMMVVDVSGSMAERDFVGEGTSLSRLEAVKRVFCNFLQGGEGLPGRPTDLVGLVTFAARPESVCPLTLSHDVLMQMLEEQQPRALPTESQTNIGDALAWGLHRLEAAEAGRKVILLLSDGDHNVPPPALKPRQAAQLAASLKVPIYTIDANPEPAEGRVNGEQTLRTIAQLTGGQYFQAGDLASLLDVCRRFDRLEQQPIESFQYRRFHEGYPWFGLAAFATWVLLGFLEGTMARRLP